MIGVGGPKILVFDRTQFYCKLGFLVPTPPIERFFLENYEKSYDRGGDVIDDYMQLSLKKLPKFLFKFFQLITEKNEIFNFFNEFWFPQTGRGLWIS